MPKLVLMLIFLVAFVLSCFVTAAIGELMLRLIFFSSDEPSVAANPEACE